MFEEGVIYINSDEYIGYLEVFDAQKPKIIKECLNEIIHEYRTHARDIPWYDFVLRESMKPWVIDEKMAMVTDDIVFWFENQNGEKLAADLEPEVDEEYLVYDENELDNEYATLADDEFYGLDCINDEGENV